MDMIVDALLHRLGEAEVQPVVQFARERVVEVHRLGLAPEDHQRVVAFHEGVAQIGTLSGSVVPVTDVSVLELEQERFVVDDLHAFEPSGFSLCRKQESRCREGRPGEEMSVHNKCFDVCKILKKSLHI